MEQFFNDIRFGLRQLLARPGFALAAVLSLAIGIGANTTLFAVVHTLLLAPVAGIGAPRNVVEIGRTDHGRAGESQEEPQRRRSSPLINTSARRSARRQRDHAEPGGAARLIAAEAATPRYG